MHLTISQTHSLFAPHAACVFFSFLEYSIDDGNNWIEMLELTYPGYMDSVVTLDLDQYAPQRTSGTRFRWMQRMFTPGVDVWTISDVSIRGVPPVEYFLQFDLATGCGGTDQSSDVIDVLFSDALEPSRQSLSELTCNPVTNCAGGAWQHPGVIYGSEASSGWRRYMYSLGINPGAQYRIMIVQPESSTNGFAVDNFYIGALCPGLCSGHGRCTLSGACVCDDGYEGPTCAVPTSPLPQSIIADFGFDDISPQKFATWTATLRSCGSSGRSAVFDSDGRQELTTQPLDLTGVSSIGFTALRCTSRSLTISFSVSTDGGVSWVVLNTYSLYSSSSSSVTVDVSAYGSGVMLRWWADISRCVHERALLLLLFKLLLFKLLLFKLLLLLFSSSPWTPTSLTRFSLSLLCSR